MRLFDWPAAVGWSVSGFCLYPFLSAEVKKSFENLTGYRNKSVFVSASGGASSDKSLQLSYLIEHHQSGIAG